MNTTILHIYDPANSVTKVLYTTYQYRQFNLSFSLQKMMELEDDISFSTVSKNSEKIVAKSKPGFWKLKYNSYFN